jgi:hypothetical protein
MPLLPTRLPPAPAAQRLRLGLDERRVRRRRPRRVLAVLLQPPRQLRDLSLQRLRHRPKLRILGGKLLTGRTRINRRHTIINNSLPKSTNHAEDLTSYSCSRVTTASPVKALNSSNILELLRWNSPELIQENGVAVGAEH